MRCHIHIEPDGTRHLIPGCWGVAMHWHLPDKEALEWCECPKPDQKTDKEVIEQLREEITMLKDKIKQMKGS